MTTRNGSTNRVREWLSKKSGTAEQIADDLQLTVDTVRSALRTMLNFSGGVIVERRGRNVVYHSHDRWIEIERTRQQPEAKKEKGPYAVAEYMTIGRGYRWNAKII